jgi:hypothetical protein
MQSFAAQIDTWCQKSKARQLAVFQRASERMFEDVIARTPVDTGFLRASLAASLDGPQPIRADARPPADAKKGSYPAPADYALVISNATIGATIFGSFGAAYARYVEYGTKFQNPAAMVRLSAQVWPLHVADAIREAKAAVASGPSR